MVPKLEIPPLGILPCKFVNGQPPKTKFSCGHTNNTQNEKHIELVIHESFKDLVRLQMFILHASLVLSDALHCDSSFSFTEPTSGDRGVWEEDEHNDTPSSAKSSTEKRLECYTVCAEFRELAYIIRNSYFQDGKAPRI